MKYNKRKKNKYDSLIEIIKYIICQMKCNSNKCSSSSTCQHLNLHLTRLRNIIMKNKSPQINVNISSLVKECDEKN